MYTNSQLCQWIFSRLIEQVRPGKDPWRVLVLAILKQGSGCDYDRLQELANRHQTVREMLGRSEGFYAYAKRGRAYTKLQTLIDNVSLLRPTVANHPFLINASYAEASMPIPWLGNRTLWFDFGKFGFETSGHRALLGNSYQF